MKFIDDAHIKLKAGNGGHGCIAFLREKFRPKGGPCGGDGGKGGDITLRGNSNLNTLLDISLKKHSLIDVPNVSSPPNKKRRKSTVMIKTGILKKYQFDEKISCRRPN